MTAFLLVFLGAGLGGALRHAVNLAALRLMGPAFPWGTLAVNLVGGFAMGLLAGWFMARGMGGQHLRLFLATGVLGGFTTFSAFALDAALLWERGVLPAAALYVLVSVTGSIAALGLGLWLAREVLP